MFIGGLMKRASNSSTSSPQLRRAYPAQVPISAATFVQEMDGPARAEMASLSINYPQEPNRQ